MFAMPRGWVVLVALAFVVPRVANAAEAAEVTCKDGTKSKGGKGACSGHGGVDKSAPEAAAEQTDQAGAKPSAKASSGTASSAESPEAAEVTCKDGTRSKGGKGACSGHGGVDKSAPGAAAAAATTGESKSKSTSKHKEAAAEETDQAGTKPSAKASSGTASSAASPEAAATVTCKDGTTSKGGKGACSGHGGIDKGHSATTAASAPASPAPAASAASATTAAAPATTAPATSASAAKASAAGKGPPTAKCKDGTLSYAQHHTGACSNHGGVAEWLDGTEK